MSQGQELMPLGDVPTTLALQSDEIKGGGASSNYVFFVHPRAEKYVELCQQLGGKVNEGTQVLMQNGEPVKLDPLVCFIPEQYKCQYWARLDSKNNVLEASLKEVRQWKEHIDCIVLVLKGDSVIPARCTFRGPKAVFARDLLKAIAESKADTETFAKKSKEHAVAAKLPQAFTRLVGTAQLSAPINPKADPSKPDASPYTVCNVDIQPVKVGQFEALKKAWGSQEFKDQLAACVADLNTRLEGIKQKVR